MRRRRRFTGSENVGGNTAHALSLLSPLHPALGLTFVHLVLAHPLCPARGQAVRLEHGAADAVEGVADEGGRDGDGKGEEEKGLLRFV